MPGPAFIGALGMPGTGALGGIETGPMPGIFGILGGSEALPKLVAQ